MAVELFSGNPFTHLGMNNPDCSSRTHMTRDFTPNEDVMVVAVLSSRRSIGSTRDMSFRMSSKSETGMVGDLDASASSWLSPCPTPCIPIPQDLVLRVRILSIL